MKQLYQIQIRGEIKQDFAVNISNQGPATVVKVQPNQQLANDLSINQWLTAFHGYMDVYLQKFPNEASGLLAYASLVRDLERSCGTQAFNIYDRSFRSHRQTQNLPWGQMHSELWNKAVLMSLSNNAATRSMTRPGFSTYNKRVCFEFTSARGCFRRQCAFNHICSFCSKRHSRVNCFDFKNQQDRVPVSRDSVLANLAAVSGQTTAPTGHQGQGRTATAAAALLSPPTPANISRTQSFRKGN